MDNEPYLVSVCVPVYKAEPYIRACAESVFKQTYARLEIIFCDDGSPDRSMEIISDVLREYPHRQLQTRLLRHDHNQGIAVTRTALIEAVTGDFAFGLDADDWIEPDAIELLVRKQTETGADIVTGKRVVNENKRVDIFDNPDYASADVMVTSFLTQEWHHELTGRLIRSSLFGHADVAFVKGCNLAEDWLVMTELAWYAAKVALIPQVIYHYRMNPHSIVHSFIQPRNRMRLMLEKYANLSSLIGFFEPKDKHYAELAQRLCAPLCLQILVLALDTSDRKVYRQFRTNFRAFPAKIRHKALDWKHRLLLRLPFSYSLLRLARMLRKNCKTE